MKTVYLICHAEHHASSGSLTENGRKHAIHVAEKLPRPAKLYTSECTAAQETAQVICDKWHVRPESLACMNEYPYQDATPTLAPPMMMGMGRTPAVPEPAAAFSFDDLRAGVEAFIKLAPKFPHRTTCVAHRTWLHLLLWYMLGLRATTQAQIEAFHAWQANMPHTEAWYLHIGDSWEIWMQVADLDNQK